MKKIPLVELTLNIVDGVHGDCAPSDNSGLYFISVKDMRDFRIDYSDARQITEDEFEKADQRTKLEENDVLFANTGDTIGKMLRITDKTALIGKTTFQKSVAILKPDTSKVDPLYFYYLIRYNIPGLRKTAVGSGQKNLLLGDMRTYKTVLPHNKEEQIRVARLLSVIDKKIENNAHINDVLQRQLKLLYGYWFIQYDFPNDNGSPYQSSGGALTKIGKSNLEIPVGWKVESLTANTLSSVIKPGVDWFESKEYLATSTVDGIDIYKGSVIDYETRENRANMQPSVYSIWFAKMKNSVKHLYLNPEMSSIINGAILSTGFFGIQCNEYSFEYLASFIENSNFEIVKDTLAHGATQEAVNNDDLSDILLAIPPDRILKLYHDKTRPIYAQISRNICENQMLSDFRDWLLALLMNGQCTIDNTETDYV